MSVACVCEDLASLSHHDRKYRFYLYYLLIADLHIFVYVRAECPFISLECTKLKLLILNNFDFPYPLKGESRICEVHMSLCPFSG